MEPLANSKNVATLLLRRELNGGKQSLCLRGYGGSDLQRHLESWQEGDFLRHCSAEYAIFNPAPRSTIALSYNCDGSLLASTHGDHTVKVTSCLGGSLVRVLSGHRRTPWVVRFHPRHPNILASGSLDHEVRLWDATTGQCIARHTFGKPIASLSFHVSAGVLAIACGHKLYMWEYATAGANPSIVLKTRRSMRAVHFHPHGMPLVLTAEVQDPTPTPDLHPTLTERAPYAGQEPNAAAPTAAAAAAERTPEEAASTYRAPLETSVPASSTGGWRYPPQTLPPSMVPVGWEVPFPAAPPRNTRGQQGEEHEVAEGGSGNLAAQLAAANYANYASVWNILGEEQPPRVRLRLWHFDAAKASTELDDARALRMTVSDAVLCSEMGVHFSPCGRYIAATVASRGPIPAPAVDAAAAVVSARAVEGMDWSPMRGPHQAEDAQQALPLLRADNASVSGYVKVQPGGPLPSPRPERVVFEVRVISIDGCTFGETARARRIRAAHCLTSVQFSPAGGHLLLAYGKKHSSLLRSLVADRGALLPLHTILEVIRLSDMELVRVLPSAEDEINAACFHPLPGCGLAYGTKEGRLRLVVHRRADEDEDTAGNDAHEDGSSAQDDEQRRSAHELGLALMQQQWMQPAELRQALAPGPAPALH